MLYLKYGQERSLALVIHAVVMNGKIVNLQNGLRAKIVVLIPIIQCISLELS